jgi:hypothetical protein
MRSVKGTFDNGVAHPAEHIAAHDLTPDDIEAVLWPPIACDISRSSRRPMVYCFTPDGRYIIVVYEAIDNHTLYPVPAYEIGA